MGLKPRITRPRVRSVRDVFEAYGLWFQATYSQNHVGDPFEKLKPLTSTQLTELEDDIGILPKDYRDLVLDIGVGELLIADQGEPVDFTILPPKHIPRVKKDCLACIDPDLLRAAESRQGFDRDKLVPILVDRDWNQWVLLANQSETDNRLFLFSHEQEQLEDADLFAHGGTIEEYFRELFANAMKRYSPWYMWTGWR